MAQADYSVANDSGANVRTDINGQLAAIVSNNSGTTAPTTTFAHQWWFDTTNNLLKQRNAANTNWVTIGSKVGDVWTPSGALITGKRMIPLRARDLITFGTAPLLEQITISGNRYEVLSFDPTTAEGCMVLLPMPKSWDHTVNITARARWFHNGGSGFGVVWSFQALAISDGDSLATALGTAVTVTDTGGTTNAQYISAESGNITVAGTPVQADSLLFAVSRAATNGSDTLTVDAHLLGVDLFVSYSLGNDA